MDSFINRTVFLKTGHALHLGRYKTDVQWGVFQGRAFCEVSPLRSKISRVQFGEFAEGEVHCVDVRHT